jgi:hypothetical protein
MSEVSKGIELIDDTLLKKPSTFTTVHAAGHQAESSLADDYSPDSKRQERFAARVGTSDEAHQRALGEAVFIFLD